MFNLLFKWWNSASLSQKLNLPKQRGCSDRTKNNKQVVEAAKLCSIRRSQGHCGTLVSGICLGGSRHQLT